MISCTVLNEENEHKGLNIFCLLNPNIDTQRIIVDTIAGIDSDSDTCYHVNNADVYINDTKCLFTRPDSNKSGYYIYTLPINYKEEYTLSLYWNGDTICRTTKIPNSVIIHCPISGSTILLDSFAFMSWSYSRRVCIIEVKKNKDTIPIRVMYQFDDTLLSIALFRDFLESGTAYDFYVIIPDSNYMGYNMGSNIGINVLDNSKGVFGSYSMSVAESITIIK